MAHEFRLPDIGEGLTEAVVVSWYAAVGEEVAMDAPLVEVETDKAIVDIPSPFAGVLLHRGAAEGETVPVGSLLAVVGGAGEEWVPHEAAAPTDSDTADAAPIVGTLAGEAEVLRRTPGRSEALPRVRKLAADLGVDLATVAGTGPGGRITESDVRAAAVGDDDRPVRRVPMSPVRRAIAEHLARSWREIPHVTTYGAADATWLLERRRELDRIPLEALLIERLAPVLVEHPLLNAAIDGTDVVERLHYDIGFAVDAPDGLMVAVVRDAGRLDTGEIAAEVRRLTEAVRSRSARPEELRGQTFTVSNIGAVGGGYGTPIVPYGTSAILSVGRAEPEAVVRDGSVVAVDRFPLSLSYDHRVIDGAAGRSAMAAIVTALEGAR